MSTAQFHLVRFEQHSTVCRRAEFVRDPSFCVRNPSFCVRTPRFCGVCLGFCVESCVVILIRMFGSVFR